MSHALTSGSSIAGTERSPCFESNLVGCPTDTPGILLWNCGVNIREERREGSPFLGEH